MSQIRIQVFLVDTGCTYHIETNLNVQVCTLKESIFKVTRIPVEKQVLLLSGGVPLFTERRLWQYESVSDNTVFLVCKSGVHEVAVPSTGSHQYSEQELTAQLESSLKLPPTLETVRSRMILVQKICDIDKRELQDIQQLVFDQHLQQQGWAAIVANLEDVCSGFEKRAIAFQKQFEEYLKIHEDIVTLLKRMQDVLLLLGKIPVLACLEDLASKVSVSLQGPMSGQSPFSSGKLTLYTWMNSQDPKYRLEDVINDVTTGTEQMGEELEKSVTEDIQKVWKHAVGNREMWLIRGIEERLYGLDKVTNNAKGIMDMQTSTKEGFRFNWARLETEKDTSILPDLCASHKKQLQEFLCRHKKLLELKNKCSSAKKELSTLIQSRLAWLMETHQNINSMDNTLLLQHDLLKRIHGRVEFLRQVEKAPQVYAMMVVEVVRRRLFSDFYMKWATGVADESKKEHKKEAHRRRAFTKQCGSHFLQKLFVGFKDHVPKFATEAPKDVDEELPGITAADISYLSKNVPELNHLLRIPTDTGSPALGSSYQQAQGDMDMDPFMIETAQSLASSSASFVTQSMTSITQSVSEASDCGRLLLRERGERDKLSLSYQGGKAWKEQKEPDENEDRLFMSLQEKCLVPQCLSETLTAEVNSAAMSTISVSVLSASPQSHEFNPALEDLGQPQQQQHPDGGGDGVLLSSGDLEPTKSSDSDVVSHESMSEHKTRSKRRSVKGLSDTSPDAETSQEFATADFYFEDSMPSSITDSPPKPEGAGKRPVEMDTVLAEKTKRVDELEEKVSALRSELMGSQEKLASLHSVLYNDVSSLRESLGALRECVQHSEGQRKQDLTEVQDVVTRLCATVGERMEREKQDLVRMEREGRRHTVEEMEARYHAKCQAMEELEQGMVKVTHCITDLNRELQHQRETSQRELQCQKEHHEEEIKNLKRQKEIEVELEMDRIRTEMQQGLDLRDAQIVELQQQLEQAVKDVAQALSEKEAASETLLLEFEVEKRQLQESLQTEKNQAVEQMREALMVESRKETESLLQKESEQKQTEMQRQLEEQKSAQERRLVEKEGELQARHQAELDSVHKEWAGKLAAQEADLQKEFNLKMERVNAELQSSVPALLREEEAQTCVSFVSMKDQEVQRDKCEVREQGEQWDKCWGTRTDSTQTSSHSVMDQDVQVNRQPNVCDADTQTDDMSVQKQEMQSSSTPASVQVHQSDDSVQTEQGVHSEGEAILYAEQHQQLMKEAVDKTKEEMSQQFEQVLADERESMKRRVAELEEQHKKDREEAVQNCKSSLLAERQINFNEVINKAVKDKDSLIEELRAQLNLMTARGVGHEGEEDSQDIRRQLVDIKEKESDLKREKQRLENEVLTLQRQLHQYSEQFQTMSASAVPVSSLNTDSPPMAQSSMGEAMARSSLIDEEARAKDQKILDLEKKLMEMSMTTSTRKEARDKVSILTCNVGDLVLLCLDERHDQYVVFTVGTTLHFLHNDCIDPLGLRAAEGEPRKNWVLAEVTEREYCQARKAQNRFKVPVNTKFYRVKAKPWVPKASTPGN